jgi:hypothetical protein
VATPPLTAQHSLEQHCEVLGRTICNVAWKLVRNCISIVDREFDNTATFSSTWTHYGTTAAFMAFVELGGSPDDPDTFDWSSPKLRTLALKTLQQLTIGSKSDVYDYMRRGRIRRNGADVAELSWSLWQTSTYDSANVPDYREQLIGDLSKVLNHNEVTWLVGKYCDRRSTAELAKDLIAKDPRYQTEDGLVRAVRKIDTAIHRAKRKARQSLDPRWQFLAQEVA